MKRSMKKTAAIAMATALSLSTVASPITLNAQENDPIIPQDSENKQPVTEKETTPVTTLPKDNKQAEEKKIAPALVLPENLQAKQGTKLETIKLPENWAWKDKSIILSNETAKYPAIFMVDDKTYDYTKVEGYNDQEHFVEVALTVKIETPKEELEATPVLTSPVLKEDVSTTPAVGDVAINETNFPDAGFREIIKKEYSINPNGDDILTADEISKVKKIYMNNDSSIVSLEGIKYFSNLENIDCGTTGITELDVSGFTNLIELRCGNTKLVKLDVSNNKKLNYLYCAGSENLNDLNVTGADALGELYCTNTALKGLDVSKNANLVNLQCPSTLAYLNIGVIDNENFTSIKMPIFPSIDLNINGSTFSIQDKFPGIDVTKISEVEGASYNSATGVFSDYKDGTPILYQYNCGTINGEVKAYQVTLNISNALIIDENNFPNAAFKSYISTNFDSDHNGTLSTEEITKTTEIDVSDNKEITNLKGIEYFTELKTLYCNGTGITELDVSNNLKLETLKCYNTKIAKLDVSKNINLSSLLCHTNPSLTSLTLSSESGNALTALYCQNTGITALDISNNLNLETLYCHNTKITELDASKNAKLANLSCYENTLLTSLTLSSESGNALRQLQCYSTGITTLDVSGNTNLSTLSCFWNELAYLNLGKQENLTIQYDSFLDPSTLDVNVEAETFKIQDKFPGIDTTKVSEVKGASYDSTTGIMSGYKADTPITYTYKCGTAKGTAVDLDVTLNLSGVKEKSEIVFNETMGKSYDGKPVKSTPVVTVKGSVGAVTYTWEKKTSATEYVAIDTPPTNVGEYRVTATAAADEKYYGASVSQNFSISKMRNIWTKELKLSGWNYGEDRNAPSASSLLGTITYLYSNATNGTFTKDAPFDAGIWYVKAVVDGTDNYTGLETPPILFIINPIYKSQIKVPDINSNTNIDQISIKDGETTLILGKDYDITKKQEGTKVTVTITLKGNYTGVITKTYTAEPNTPIEDPNGENNKPTGPTNSGNTKPSKDTPTNKNPSNTTKTSTIKTGDTTNLGLWAMFMSGAVGVLVLLKGKKNKEEI